MSNILSDITVKLNIETPSIPVNMGNLAMLQLLLLHITQKVGNLPQLFLLIQRHR